MAKPNGVNKCLTELCFERNFLVIDHSKTLKSQHLNGNKLHLNKRGTPILQNTFTMVLSRIFSSQKDENNVASTSLLNEEYIPEAKNYINKININGELRSLRDKNLNKLIIGHSKINSLRNKFELLTHQIKDNADILMISETKLDERFPTSQFFMNGFSSPHCLDRNYNGGGIILYIREDIPSKHLSVEKNLTEAILGEINLRNKKKWLISCFYNPKRASIANHISVLNKSTDIYTCKYDSLTLLGDFNAGVEVTDKKKNCSSYKLTSMVNKATCYKNPSKPTYVDIKKLSSIIPKFLRSRERTIRFS